MEPDRMPTEQYALVGEYYPADAYARLGLRVGGVGQAKTDAEHRRSLADALLAEVSAPASLADDARSAILGGFTSDDDFDAMVDVILALWIAPATYQQTRVPAAAARIEGWIMGLERDKLRR